MQRKNVTELQNDLVTLRLDRARLEADLQSVKNDIDLVGKRIKENRRRNKRADKYEPAPAHGVQSFYEGASAASSNRPAPCQPYGPAPTFGDQTLLSGGGGARPYPYQPYGPAATYTYGGSSLLSGGGSASSKRPCVNSTTAVPVDDADGAFDDELLELLSSAGGESGAGQAARSFVPHTPASCSSKSSFVHDDLLADVQEVLESGKKTPSPEEFLLSLPYGHPQYHDAVRAFYQHQNKRASQSLAGEEQSPPEAAELSVDELEEIFLDGTPAHANSVPESPGEEPASPGEEAAAADAAAAVCN
eukprot:g19684.t1